MKAIYVPSQGPEDWKRFLAKPELQWRDGYSAKTLARCWESFDGLPPEIASLFPETPEILFAVPEHKVRLPGGNRDSQNDIFALLRTRIHTIAATIEGKVNEPFGPTVGEWQINASAGKTQRLEKICTMLGLSNPGSHIRYQLLHRTASAVIEAERFKTDQAAMIVHHFDSSQDQASFDDYAAFVHLFGSQAEKGRLAHYILPSGRPLLLGWAYGDAKFLSPQVC